MEIKQALYTAMRFNFLYAGRYVFRTGWTYPESYIPYNMVRYIVKGDAVFIIDGRKIVVHEKQIVYIPEGCRLAVLQYPVSAFHTDGSGRFSVRLFSY